MPIVSAFPRESFHLLGSCSNEHESVQRFLPRIDRLIHLLNRSDGCQRIARVRSRWHPGKGSDELFAERPMGAVEYVRGGRAHWYIIHRGGRWEPQFNVGMFGGPVGQARYVRFGVGFCLNLHSQDPEREARLIDLEHLFHVFVRLLRGPHRQEVRRLLSTCKHLTLERDGAVPDTALDSPDRIIDWLLAWEHPSGWVFLGDRLSPDVASERQILENWYRLITTIDSGFAAWQPVWEMIWREAAD